MRSKVHIKSHPLHPILVGFPITFFISTLGFDLVSAWRDSDKLAELAGYLNMLGIIFAVAAAIPGLIDYIKVIPPGSSAKKRGAQHGILNSLALLFFVGAWFYRSSDTPQSTWLVLIELVAVVLMGISGWLGGTLVHRNQIGIDHRYADAGKWKEKRIDSNDDVTELAKTDDLKVNQMMLIHFNGKRIVLGRTEDGFVAFDDFCSHRGASLADGAMICGQVQCPWHGSQFDCKTGAVTAGPAKDPIETYQVTTSGNRVLLQQKIST